MNKYLRKSIGLITALALLAAQLIIPSSVQADAANQTGQVVTVTSNTLATASEQSSTPSNIQDGVTLHCWNWSYKNIEANMALIASQGYTAIQTSPVQQVKEATKNKPMGNWWVLYQPVSFSIDSTGSNALGTKAEFESMCATAHAYGIKVIVDVVANHMANAYGNDLSSAIIDDLEYDSSCWHDITKNTYDYSKRYDITQWCMSGLPDLNTGNTKVQNYVLNFLKECIDSGADGFRFDAAKHIETPEDTSDNCASNFWPTVINGAKSYASSTRGITLYCYGELLEQPDSAGKLPISAYTKYMSVTDNTWSNSLRGTISGGNASGFSYLYHKGAPASQLVLWAESHDNYANEGSGNVSTQNINKIWALIAARADAMSLYFARPTNMSSQKMGDSSITGWSYPEVKAANLFHNAFVGQTEYVANENNIAYVERGTSGVILVNCSGTSSSINVTAHTMANGTYKDQITGNTFTVSGGRITGTIGSTGIAVVYNASASSTPSTPDVAGDNIAYIDLPSGWESDVYCYVYDSVTSVENAIWPGIPMTHVSGSIYKYEVPDNITSPMVIFYSSASHRFPGDMEPGLPLSGSMIYEDGVWKTYTPATGSVLVKYVDGNGNTISSSVTMEGEVGTSYSTSAKTISGYTFSKVVGSASGVYTDGQITVQYVYTKNAVIPETTTEAENDTTENPGDDRESSSSADSTTEDSGEIDESTEDSNNGGSNTTEDSNNNGGNNTTADSDNNGGSNTTEDSGNPDDESTAEDSGEIDESTEDTTESDSENNTGSDDESKAPETDENGTDDSAEDPNAPTDGDGDNSTEAGGNGDIGAPKQNFPWAAVIILVVILAGGAGGFIWWKRKKQDEETGASANE